MDRTRRWALAARVASIAATSLFAIGPAHAQNAEAEQRFVEAEARLAAGKTAEACALFEESNRIEPRAGTFINIGLCKEKLGRLASALAAFRGALARVKDPKKKAIATERVAALEPRVSHLTISVAPRDRVRGLSVSRDGQPVDEADYGRPSPVDGGSYTIAASAPGYQPWSTTVRVAPERDKASVSVPRLVEEAAPGGEGTGKLVVNGNVPRGDVFIDGSKQGRLEDGAITLTLPEGTHELAIEAPGRKRYAAKVSVERGQTRTIDAALEELVEPPPATAPRSSTGKVLKATGWGIAGVAGVSLGYALYLSVAGPIQAYSPTETMPERFNPTTMMFEPITGVGMGQCETDLGQQLRAVPRVNNIAFDEACRAITRRTISFVLALAAGITSTAMLYLAYSGDDRPTKSSGRKRREVTVLPSIGPDGGGAMLRFAW